MSNNKQAQYTTVPAVISVSCAGTKTAPLTFEHGSFAEALAKSKTTGKPIFFDAYTAWCIPCQMMLKKVFTVIL